MFLRHKTNSPNEPIQTTKVRNQWAMGCSESIPQTTHLISSTSLEPGSPLRSPPNKPSLPGPGPRMHSGPWILRAQHPPLRQPRYRSPPPSSQSTFLPTRHPQNSPSFPDRSRAHGSRPSVGRGTSRWILSFPSVYFYFF